MLLLPFVASGCSLLFVDGPPDGYQDMDDFYCTEGSFAPSADFLIAGTFAMGAFAQEGSKGGAFVGGVVGIALVGASAIVGLNRVSDCRAAKIEAVRAEEAARSVLEPSTFPSGWTRNAQTHPPYLSIPR